MATACTCGGISRDGVCDRCGPRKSVREKTTDRGYGGDWQRTRKLYLRRNPICVDCKANGTITKATEVHHVCKIKERPELRLKHDNLMALCGQCHDARSAKGE